MVEHRCRKGKTYYLHVKNTAAGRQNYFFSTDASGQLAPAIPDGHEVFENVSGQVFLRKKTAQAIRPDELALVEAALLRHGEPWQYRAEVKKNAIVIYAAGEMNGLDELTMECRGRRLSGSEKMRHASYLAVMRFVLVDKQQRSYATERFCFRGSVDDWIPVGGPCTLADQLRQFIKHLGRESLYELY